MTSAEKLTRWGKQMADYEIAAEIKRLKARIAELEAERKSVAYLAHTKCGKPAEWVVEATAEPGCYRTTPRYPDAAARYTRNLLEALAFDSREDAMAIALDHETVRRK